MPRNSVGIIGAGIVGIATALELRDRGFDVVLIDRGLPGKQTSFGNAGVLSGSTVLTVNNPGIWRQLPQLMFNQSPYFRYDASFVLAYWRWLAAFLAFSTNKHVMPRARALRELQMVSMKKHHALIERAKTGRLLNSGGWIKVFRSRKGFDRSQRERTLMRALDVPFELLSKRDLAEFEPSLRRVFYCGMHIPGAGACRDPHALTRSYMDLYEQTGGRFMQDSVVGIHNHAGTPWSVQLADADPVRVEQLVVAAGPWAPDICAMLGYRIPMAWERGYHVHLEAPVPQLARPVCDVESGVVMSPQASAVRITCGVELAHRDAPPNYTLIRRAVAAARTAAGFGRALDDTPWLGSRPTLPDGLPMIGAAPRHDRLWFNFGHQHIGFSTSAGSAALLVEQMEGQQQAVIDPGPFSPGRFAI